MRAYFTRRILQMIPVIIGITLVSFTIIHLAPGDPLMLLTDSAEMTPENEARLRALYGLDQPLHIQYLNWLKQLLVGNFGKSFVEGRSVLTMILERLPNTIYLNLVVMALSLSLSIPAGIISAVRQYSMFDYTVTVMAFIGDAMPSFWLSLMLIYLFAVNLGWLPTSGMSTYGVKLASNSFIEVFADRMKYMALPVFVMVFGGLTSMTRYMRTCMLEVIRQDYIRTARSKGLSEKVVIYRHALKNAMIPVVTLLAMMLPGLIGGSVIIERIFSWPGVGLLSFRAIGQRDYQVVMAFNTIGALAMILANLLMDAAYVAVDPRIKYS